MKQQIPVWVALTFLMVFLVVFAGFVFTLQTRGQLVANVGTLESELAREQEKAEVVAAEATRSSLALADAEATRDGLAAAINQLQTQDELPGATETPVVVQVVTPQVSDGPIVSLVSPTDGMTVLPGEAVEILVSVSDQTGVETVTLLVDDVVLGDFSAENQVLFTVKEPWTSEEPGRFKIGASAINSNGIASQRVEVNVEFGDREAALREAVATIQAQVEGLRGIEATEPIALTLYTSDELRAELETIFLEDLNEEEASRDVIELYAFDFVDYDYPLYDKLVELYSAAILGFYDPEDKTLVVVSDDGELSPGERLTLAHEIDHALQDQQFGLEFEDEDSEASYARRALAEGEAVLLESLYVASGYFSAEELAELTQEAVAQIGQLPTDLPPVILQQLSFPYERGLDFVQTFYEQGGGFGAVDAIWENPPISTEQILHPDSYLSDDLPQIIGLPAYTDTLGTDWQFISEGTLGEFSTSLYLEQQVDLGQSELAAAGWGGDRYAVYWNPISEEVVMVLLGVWDSGNDEVEFSRAAFDYAGNKYAVDSTLMPNGSRCWIGDFDVMCLYQINGTTLLIRAPDTDIVNNLRLATRIP